MWAEREKFNNNFLQKQLKHLQPQKINEMVKKTFITEVKKHRPKSIHHHTTHFIDEPCKSANYFEDRAELAYGFYALPKLMQEMACDNYLIHFKAINSLADYVKNPLHAQRAISQFNIVRRCQNILLRIRYNYHKVPDGEMGRLLEIFLYISMHANGADEIVNKFRLLTVFYEIIRNRGVHMAQVAKILPFISYETTSAKFLIDNFKVYDHLEPILKRDICVPYYSEDFWLHLTHIFEAAPEEAINRGFFEILHTRIKGRLYQFHRWDIKCFGLLLHCPEGHKRFMTIDGLKEIYTILTDEDHKLDSYENVIFALVNGFLAKEILWRCREFTDLPLIIMKLCHEKENLNQQLLCLQTLREMGEMPCIKRFIKENCLEDLKTIECAALVNEEKRIEIIYWLEREIFHITDLRKI